MPGSDRLEEEDQDSQETPEAPATESAEASQEPAAEAESAESASGQAGEDQAHPRFGDGGGRRRRVRGVIREAAAEAPRPRRTSRRRQAEEEPQAEAGPCGKSACRGSWSSTAPGSRTRCRRSSATGTSCRFPTWRRWCSTLGWGDEAEPPGPGERDQGPVPYFRSETRHHPRPALHSRLQAATGGRHRHVGHPQGAPHVRLHGPAVQRRSAPNSRLPGRVSEGVRRQGQLLPGSAGADNLPGDRLRPDRPHSRLSRSRS